ncbi:MAG: organomercurial lyase [Micromonosporaceae bacterium]
MPEEPSLEFRKASAAAGLSPGARRLHLAILTGFVEAGAPPTAEELRRIAADHGIDVVAATAELAERDVVVFDESGEVSAAYPFSVAPTGHRVSWQGISGRHSMCAIDALGTSAMLDRPVTVTSADPATGEAVVVEVDRDRAVWSPPTAVVYAGSTGESCCCSAERACGFVNFFATLDSIETWLAGHPGITGSVLDQEQALSDAIGGFGDLMRPGAAVPPES